MTASSKYRTLVSLKDTLPVEVKFLWLMRCSHLSSLHWSTQPNSLLFGNPVWGHSLSHWFTPWPKSTFALSPSNPKFHSLPLSLTVLRPYPSRQPLLQQIYCPDASFWPCEANSLDKEGLVHTLVYLCAFSLIYIWITFWSFLESLGTVGGVPPEDQWSQPMFPSGIFQTNKHRNQTQDYLFKGWASGCVFASHTSYNIPNWWCWQVGQNWSQSLWVYVFGRFGKVPDIWANQGMILGKVSLPEVPFCMH